MESEKKFYKIIVSNEHSLIETSKGNDWQSVHCPEYPGHQRPGKRITPLHVEFKNKKVVDFSRTMLSDIVVTNRVIEIFQDYQVCCFEKKDIFVKKNRFTSKNIIQLFELVVTGNGGDAHPDSEIILKKYCSACGLERYSAFEKGIKIDTNKWDGSDLFTIKGYPKYFFVSEKLKAIIEKEKLTNITFIESTQLKWPEGVNKP